VNKAIGISPVTREKTGQYPGKPPQTIRFGLSKFSILTNDFFLLCKYNQEEKTMVKEKKKHKFFNVVIDEKLMTDIRELRQAGVNWQSLTRNFLQLKAEELRSKQTFGVK